MLFPFQGTDQLFYGFDSILIRARFFEILENANVNMIIIEITQVILQLFQGLDQLLDLLCRIQALEKFH